MEVYDFGLRLRELRERKSLTQTEVASRLKLQKATISGYERNITTPSLDVLIQIALLYNSSTDYILGLTDRKCFYLDGLTESQQETLLKMVDDLKKEFNRD